MRLVTKNTGRGAYTHLANQTPPTTSAEARLAWTRFKGRNLLKSALLEDQYGLCCYTEINADSEGWDYHVEHIENKSQNPVGTFDLCNLGASALSDQDLQRLKPTKENVFGGHAVNKAKNVDMTRFVHFHLHDCSKFFAYLSTGDVVPALGLSDHEKVCAQYTIEHLNLNSPFLQLLRKKWHAELEEAYAESVIDKRPLQELVKVYFTPVNQKLKKFFTMSQQFFV